MNIIFAGTPLFAQIQLQALIEAGFKILAVYTQPDRPVGRGLKLQPSPVKETALAANLPIEQPIHLKSEETQARMKAYQADLMIVSAYGLILPKAILEIPKLGCWNVHASLLPRWRGAAPIQHAILAGETQTGITLMQMDEGLDTGAILVKKPLKILNNDTSASLYEKLAHLGAKLLLTVLAQQASGLPLHPIAQDNTKASFAPKITKAQAKLDWHQKANVLFNSIRAFNPWPVAYTSIEGMIIKIWEAELIPSPILKSPLPRPGTIIHQSSLGLDVLTGQGVLRLTQIQLPNKRKMSVQEVINSKHSLFAAGRCFD